MFVFGFVLMIIKILCILNITIIFANKRTKMKQIDDITWQSNDGLITFKNMDCNEFMAGCKRIQLYMGSC